jgi:ACS family glucarate transporter-like MFS transporter
VWAAYDLGPAWAKFCLILGAIGIHYALSHQQDQRSLRLAAALLWYWYARDFPRQHPHVNQAEAAIIEDNSLDPQSSPLPSNDQVQGQGKKHPSTPVPWKAILTTPTVWWLILSYTCLGYVAYIYMSWFYLYLVNVRGFAVLQGAFFASAPFIAMTVFCPLGGWVTDRLAGKYGINWGRASVGGSGMILAAFCIIIGANVEAPYVAIGFLSLGAGWLYFTVGPFWSSTTDLSKPYAGTLSGLMNTGANLGGTLSPTLTPWIADTYGWPIALGLAAVMALVGGICWLFIKPGLGLKHP